MTYRPNTRDRVVHALANAVIRMASTPYQRFITAVVALGRQEFDRLSQEGPK